MDENKEPKRSRPIAFKDLMSKKFPDVEWIVEKLVPSGAITVISGSSAVYKTWFILGLALTVAAGKLLFDRFSTSQSGVLIIDEENGERLLQGRLQKLCKETELPIHFMSFANFKADRTWIDEIKVFVRDNNIRLIIIDSLVRIHNADENDAGGMARVMDFVRQLTKEGPAVIMTHHHRKQGVNRANPSQDMRGSSDILASIDCHLSFERNREDKSLLITQTKLRHAEEMKPFRLEVHISNTDFGFVFKGEAEEYKPKKKSVEEAIVSILTKTGRLSNVALFGEVKKVTGDISYSTFNTAKKKLLDIGALLIEKGPKNKSFLVIKR